MSQAILDATGAGMAHMGLDRGDHQYPPQSAPTQQPREMSNFVDGSGPIFSMYLEMATEEDKKMVEGWKADAEGILVFTGLFSAAVASLISVSIQDIRPNPQDTSNFYLANIYQTLADPNIASSLPTSPPPFSPPNYAVWVNAFLFLSLVISISCALLATLLQQWARRYLKVTQPRYSQQKRARIRAFFFEGVEKFFVPWAVEALPTLLHVSLFLFFAGISVFLWNVNLMIFKSVVSWIGVCTALYGCITFVPIFHHDSPYHTPLSLPAWHIITGISYVIFRALRRLTMLDYFSGESYLRFRSLKERYRKLLVQGMQRTAEETALNAPSEIDTRAFLWTFDSLDEDHELERFFSGLPGFRSSKVVDDPLPHLTREQKWRLSTTLMWLLDVTFSSNLLPEPVKDRRAMICAKAFDPAHIPVFGVFDEILFRCQYSGPMSTELVQIMSGWGNNTNLVALVCMIIARAQRRDDSWFILASRELGVQESVLRDYAAYGDSLSLAILIHVTRQQFTHFREAAWPEYKFSEILETASKFNVQDTLPELQHEFCALWNQIVLEAQNANSRKRASLILRPIRAIYISLHQDTNSEPTRLFASISDEDDILSEPSSYPACNVAGHLHDDSSTTTITRTVLHDNAALVPASSSVPAPLRIDESLTDVLPLDNFHPTHPTTIESLRIPITSQDAAIASVIRDIENLGITMPRPTPEISASPTLSLTSPPAAVAFQHNTDHLTPSDAPNLPSSTYTVLDNILLTGPPLSSRLSIARSGLSSSYPESHHSMIVTSAPSASPESTSVPDLGAAVVDDGIAKPGLRKEQDTFDPPFVHVNPSVNRSIYTNPMPTLDLPPQPPSLLSVTDLDITIAGPSIWESNVERIGDRPPHLSHGQYNIV